MNTLPAVLIIEGELLEDAVVTAEQMARLNEARVVFSELRTILMSQVIPSLEGGWKNPLGTEIERRLEDIIYETGNFLWKNRHAGASHDAIHVGGVQ